MTNPWQIESLEPRCLLSGLTSAEVSQIISQAAAVSLPSQTIVVCDINGNVLAVYGQAPPTADQTALPTDAAALVRVNKQGVLSGALGQNTSAKYALINATAEARTAAFFESTQDAFTTRTARFIVQNDFPQPIKNTEAGPLLGVEFSGAAGSDALPPAIDTGLAAGLSGTIGGVPLFLNGVPVGGIGVSGDGSDVAARQDLVPKFTPGVPFADQTPAYRSDPTGAFYAGSDEYDFDEAVALAGSQGFTAPEAIQATNIFVNGLRFPYTAEGAATGAPPSNVPGLTDHGVPLADLPARTYFMYMPIGANVAGPIDTPASIYPTTPIPLTNGTIITGVLKNNNPAAGGAGVNAADTFVANGGFAPILNSSGAVTGWTHSGFGIIPGKAAEGDFLTRRNVLQIVSQALTEALSIRGAIRVPSDVPAEVHVAVTDLQGDILTVVATPDATNFSFDVAVQKARTSAYFSDDTHAFSARAIGFLSDSTLPPAIENGVTGPLYQLQESLALPQNQAEFMPFEIVNGVTTSIPNPLGDGITIFPGGAPLYKNGHLVGAIGISGDGVDQDDLISFAGSVGFTAPAQIQDDHLSSGQIVSFLTAKIKELRSIGFTFPPINNPAAPFSLNTLFADPDVVVGNPDHIGLNPTDTIINRILKRLRAVGVDGVNLPFQKFPRNPEL